jgi:hypothetical protein
MKIIKVNSCKECPYCRMYAANSYYCRNTANYRILDNRENLPVWCPLEDEEQHDFHYNKHIVKK